MLEELFQSVHSALMQGGGELVRTINGQLCCKFTVGEFECTLLFYVRFIVHKTLHNCWPGLPDWQLFFHNFPRKL